MKQRLIVLGPKLKYWGFQTPALTQRLCCGVFLFYFRCEGEMRVPKGGLDLAGSARSGEKGMETGRVVGTF